jgi:hypothetical protein
MSSYDRLKIKAQETTLNTIEEKIKSLEEIVGRLTKESAAAYKVYNDIDTNLTYHRQLLNHWQAVREAWTEKLETE